MKRLKKVIFLCSLILTAYHGKSQNIGINSTGATPHNASILDLNTGNTFTSPNGKGFLPPNVALSSRTDITTIANPPASLLVYNTASAGTGTSSVSPGYYYFDGAVWVAFIGPFANSQDWTISGNAGTTPTLNFLGTTDNADMAFRTNNVEHVRIHSAGLFHNMQNNFINTSGSDSEGGNVNAGGGGTLTWRLNNGGYAGSFYNQSTLGNANGLIVKTAGTASTNTIFDVSTGSQSVAGTPVLTARGNGRVGIGTNNPANKLEITHGTSGNSGLRFSNLPNAPLLATNSSGDVIPASITTATSNGLFWSLVGNANTTPGTNFLGTTDNNDLVFKTNNSEKARITSSLGAVCIGTTSSFSANGFGSKLHVSQSTFIHLTNNNYAVYNAFAYNNSSNVIGAFVGAKARGTEASPGYPLANDVLTGFYGRDAIDCYASSYGGGGISVVAAENFSNLNKGTDMQFFTTNTGTNVSTEKMTIKANGNIGIGNQLPNNKLEITHGTFGNSGLRLSNLPSALALATNSLGDVIPISINTATSNGLFWSLAGNAGTTPTLNFLGTTDNADLALSTNNTEAVRIATNGNVGIGTTSPTNKMEVFGGWYNNINQNGFSGYAGSLYSSLSQQHAVHFIGIRGRGTYLAPLQPLNGDVLATFQGRGLSGGFTGMSVEAAENQSNSALGAKIRFHTVPNGSTAVVDRIVIEHDGKVGIGAFPPNAQLDVASSSTVGADAIVRLTRNAPNSIGFINFHSGVSTGDWTQLATAGDKSIIFSNDLNPNVDAPTGLLIAPWASTINTTGATKGIKIMENGNVGVGTATPGFRLHTVADDPSISVAGYFIINPNITSNTATNYHAAFNIVNPNSPFSFTGDLYGGVNRIQAGMGQSGTLSNVIGSTNDVYNNSNSAIANAIGSAGYVINTANGSITTAKGMEAYIFNSGTGSVNNGYGLFISNIQATNKWSIYSNDASTQSYIAGNLSIGTPTTSFKFEVAGTTACAGNTWTSDRRKKSNIQKLNLNAIETITKLNPVTYNWTAVIDDGMKGTQMGFIAQEIEEILPNMVITKNDDEKSKSVKYLELFPILVKAIQEQQTQIELLKTENNNLKFNQQKLSDLEAKVNTLLSLKDSKNELTGNK